MTQAARNPIRELASSICRPLIVRLPRGQHFAYRWICGDGRKYDRVWRKSAQRHRIFYDRWANAFVYADLGDWAGRKHYFCGRYRDVANLLLVQRFLNAGDTYIDVGANYGLYSLCACAQVGRIGRVFAFEPNGHPAAVLNALLRLNGFTNCVVHNVALGSESTHLVLAGADDHTGTYNLRNDGSGDQRRQLPVEVRRGDELLQETDLVGRVLMKIDTEGFEERVLTGMVKLLQYPRLAISIEVTDSWLQRLGSSARELFDRLLSAGFRAFLPSVDLRSRRLEITSISGPADQYQYDVFFSKEGFAGGCLGARG